MHPFVSMKKQAEILFGEFIEANGEIRISESDVDELLQRLNRIFNKEIKSINVLLKLFTTKRLERMSRDQKKSTYHKYKLIEEQDVKK